MSSKNPLIGSPQLLKAAKVFVANQGLNPKGFFPGDYLSDTLQVNSSERFYLLEAFYAYQYGKKAGPYVYTWVQKLIAEAEEAAKPKVGHNPFIHCAVDAMDNKHSSVGGYLRHSVESILNNSDIRIIKAFPWAATGQNGYWNEAHAINPIANSEQRAVIKGWVFEYLGKKF